MDRILPTREPFVLSFLFSFVRKRRFISTVNKMDANFEKQYDDVAIGPFGSVIVFQNSILLK